MNSHQIENKILQNTKDLSTEALNEILDFILFIRERNKTKTNGEKMNDLSLLNEAELVHLEQEFNNYKEEYPYE